MHIRTVTAIRPILNGAPLIARTVESIVNQSVARSGRLNLTYIVRDRTPTDGTAEAARAASDGAALDVISKAADRLTKFANPRFMLAYERDSGERR